MKINLVILFICLVIVGCKKNQTAISEQSDGFFEFNETYASMEEAEDKLIAALESHYPSDTSYSDYRMPNHELIDFLFKEPKSLSYDFPKLKESGYVSDIVTSDDGNLRFYYWDTATGGTMIVWDDICQYREGDDVFTLRGSVLDVESMNDNKESEDELDIGCAVIGISTLKATSNNKVYLVDAYVRESSGWAYRGISAVKIKDGDLWPANIFTVDGKKTNVVGVEYNLIDWYDRANAKQRWDWVLSFNKSTNTLYVPAQKGYMTDRYVLYKYDGEQMDSIGVDGGYWLHPSIRQFKSLECLFSTKDYTIRVDKMENETYRYASWKNPKDIGQLPDIIIYNGYYNESAEAFEFLNDDCIYKVDGEQLKVFKSGKCILSQSVRNYD